MAVSAEARAAPEHRRRRDVADALATAKESATTTTNLSRLRDHAARQPGAVAYGAKDDGEWVTTSWARFDAEVRQAGRALIALIADFRNCLRALEEVPQKCHHAPKCRLSPKCNSRDNSLGRPAAAGARLPAGLS